LKPRETLCFYLDLVAYVYQIAGMRQPSPAHVGNVQQAVDAAQVDKRAVVGQVLHRAGKDRAFAQVLESGGALGVLLFLENFLAADHDVAALLVQLDDPDLNLLTQVAVQVAHRTNLKLRTGQERLQADVHRKAALDAADHSADHRGLVVGGLFDRVPHPQTLRALVADQIAAFRLLALDDHINHVAGVEPDRSGVIQNLLQRHQAFGLQAHVYHQVLLGLFDHGAGDNLVSIGLDGCRLGGLLTLKSCQRGRKVVHGLKSMLGGLGVRGYRSRCCFGCWRLGCRLRLGNC
jgi:hypothetical protein